MKFSNEPDSDEDREMIKKIGAVLRKHVEPKDPGRPNHDAFHFENARQGFLSDFWPEKVASDALKDLRPAINILCDIYESLPVQVRDALKIEASGVDWRNKEDFLKTTDVFFSSSAPAPRAEPAIQALNTLAENRQLVLSVLSIVNAALPEGIETRNRPGLAWAVVHAAYEISENGSRINVPKKIDESGPFHRLLKDLFELFEIEQSVRGAFRGWRRHMDNKYENFDLMPI